MNNVQKYKNYILYNWWTHLDNRDIDGWLKNFGDRESIGRLILDNTIFYTEEQMKSYTLNIVNQLKTELYEREMQKLKGKYQDDDYFNEKWKEYKKTIKIIPADTEEEAGGSQHLVARKYRSCLGGETTAKVGSIQKECENGVRELIFVDDFSGTGKQMDDFLSTQVSVQEKEIQIGRLTEYFPKVKVSVAVYVIHKEALKRLEKFKAINVRYVDLVDEDLNLLNENCVIYRGKDKNEVQEIIKYLTDLRSRLIEEQPEYRKLAEYALNIPVVFEHGCPNNTFLPLFAKTPTWKQLFRRGEEI